jgi:hypothetical protein
MKIHVQTSTVAPLNSSTVHQEESNHQQGHPTNRTPLGNERSPVAPAQASDTSLHGLPIPTMVQTELSFTLSTRSHTREDRFSPTKL